MDDALLASVAERFGTPVYVYDLRVVRARVERLRAALPGAALRFAVKANPNGDVLRALAALDVGAEAITLGELERALRAGMPAASVVIGGPRQDAPLVQRAVEAGVGLVSLDGAGQWPAWRDTLAASAREAGAEAPTRFVVRVNPALDPRTHEHLATGAASSKFGIPAAAAAALAREVADAGRLAGFHVHAGSMIRELDVYDAIFSVLELLFAELPGHATLDLGGGFAVPDFPLEGFAQRARAFVERHGLELVLEPGRFLVADAGTLLTRVLHAKEGEPPHVIADAGMADLVRPALYDAEHPIRIVAEAAQAGEPVLREGALVDVDGPLCENADRLGRRRPLAAARPGTLLAVGQAGAYGFGMASNYASSLRPAEVVVEDPRGAPHVDVRLSRRRERPEDLWRLEDELA